MARWIHERIVVLSSGFCWYFTYLLISPVDIFPVPSLIPFNKLFSTMTSPFFCHFAWQVQYFSGVFYTFELSFSFYSFPFLNAAELRLFAQNWVPYCLRVLASQTPTPLLIIFAIHILRWTIVRFTSTRRHRPQASWPTSPIHLWICPRGSCCSRFSPWSPFR